MESVHLQTKTGKNPQEQKLSPVASHGMLTSKPNQVSTVVLYGIPIVSLVIENQERLCLAQISNTLLKQFSYNEIHNRRVALGITCVQCTPVQLEILRRAGAMPVSSRRCGMITRREAERLCKSFLGDNAPPRLPEDFAFSVHHECAWGCRGAFLPSRYNSSRAKCIKCTYCGLFFSPNKFIFHSHRTGPTDKYIQPDAANFNSWRRHMKLSGTPPDEIVHAWEDVKAMFNGGTRKRLLASSSSSSSSSRPSKQPKLPSPTPSFSVPSTPIVPSPRVPPFPELPLPISRSLVMDYMWQNQAKQFPFPSYATLPWLKRNSGPLLFPHEAPLLGFHQSLDKPMYQSAFRPVQPIPLSRMEPEINNKTDLSDDEVDIETTDDKEVIVTDSESPSRWSPKQETKQPSNMEETSSQVSIDPCIETSVVTPSSVSPRGDTPPCSDASLSPSRHSTQQHQPSPSSTAVQASGSLDRLWSISRITFDRHSPLTTAHHPMYCHHPVQDALARHLHIVRDGASVSRSSTPLSMKALDCSACQGHQPAGIYSAIETNNKLSP